MRYVRCFPALVLLALASCRGDRAGRARVLAGSRVPHPAFLVGGSRPPDAVQVSALGRYRGGSGGLIYWALAVVPGAATPLDTLRYGEPPPGYAATKPAGALFPGRYQLDVITAGGHRITYFRVRNDGSVTESSPFY